MSAPVSIKRVANFGVTLGTLGQDGQPLAYLTVEAPNGDVMRFQLDSAHTATSLSANLLDLANQWPE